MGKQILIVEDEGIVATDIQRRVTRMGYDAPQITSSGDEAISQAAQNNPDLVLMDIHLKGSLDGISAAEKIHGSLGIPVVFLTAYSDEVTLRRAKASEPYGYLLKPFGETELRMAIEIALQNHAVTRRLDQKFTSTLSSMADGVICINERGEVLSMNPAAESLTRFAENEAEGKPIGQVLRVKDEIVSQLTSDVLDGRDTRRLYPLTLSGPEEGALVPLEARVAPLRDKHHKLSGAVLVIRELTSRESHGPASRQPVPIDRESRAGLLVRAFPDTIFRLDRSGEVLDVHLPGEDESKMDAMVGKNLYESHMPRPVVDQILSTIRLVLEKGEARTLEFLLPSPRGVTRHWAQVVPSGRDEAVMIVRDITGTQEPRVLQTVATRDLLHKEVEAFAESVDEALRNPLLTTYEVCDHFTKYFNTYLPAEGRACVRLLKEKSAEMRQTVDEMTFYLGLKSRPIQKTPVKMRDVVRGVANEVSRRYGSRQVELTIDEQVPDCFACAPLLRQLLTALFDNAFKFTRRRNQALVEFGSRRVGDEISYYIADNGVGFDDRFANQIFGPFQRLHRAGSYPGIGLGLAIAQRIVERHEGSIWAEGRIGKGATISFVLPYH
jgi:PAS domain S-box-containing protein